MNALSDFFTGFQQGNAITQQQRDQRQQNQLSQLAPSVISGDPQAFAQAASIDPQAAAGYQAAGNQIAQRARGAARFLQSALQAGNPAQIAAARQAIKPFMDTLKPGTSYPLDMDPAQELAGLQGFLAQTAHLDQQGGQGLAPRVVGNALVDSSGNVLYQAPQDQKYQWDSQRGVWIPQPGAASAQGASPSVYIDPSLPPEVQDQIRAAEAAGQEYNGVQAIPVAGVSARPDITPADAQRLENERRRLALAEAASARADAAEARAARGEQRSLQANAISGRPPTEDERKAAGWLNQAEFARQQMEEALAADPEAATPGLVEAYSPSDELANRTMSPARQRYAQAASSFAEAALRAATGAGINEFEARQKIRELTPQRGDSPEVIAQKGRAQQQYIESLRARAGRALQATTATPPPAGGASIEALLEKYR